jgi:very-short-patch-repair endonuclease
MSIEINDEYMVKLYEKGMSTYEIAKIFDTYANDVRRKLLAMGVNLRSKSEAQKRAIQSGRHTHPTKGRKRTESEKEKISNSVAKKWEEMTPEERERRCQISKEKWDAMTEEERANFQKKSSEAVREAAHSGSKLEKFLLVELQRHGFKVEFHRKSLVENEELEMDLFLPALFPPVVIEIDGPSHFFPIWGEESLEKHVKADKEKNGLLMSSGYSIIRVKHLVKNLSEIHKRKVLTSVLETLKSLEGHSENKLVEIEVK